MRTLSDLRNSAGLGRRHRPHFDNDLVDFAGEAVVAFFVIYRYGSRVVDTDASRFIEREAGVVVCVRCAHLPLFGRLPEAWLRRLCRCRLRRRQRPCEWWPCQGGLHAEQTLCTD